MRLWSNCGLLGSEFKILPRKKDSWERDREVSISSTNDCQNGSGITDVETLGVSCGSLKNEGKRNTRDTSLAKWQACNFANEAANDAVQIHGAYGYSNEYPVERYLRNSKASVIYEGTREIRTVMQANYLLGYREDKELRKMLPKWPYEPARMTIKKYRVRIQKDWFAVQ